MGNVTALKSRTALTGVLGAVLLATWVVVAPQVDLPEGNPGWYVIAVMVPSLLLSMLLVARLPGTAVTRLITTMTLCHLFLVASEAVRLWRAEHGGPPYDHLENGAGLDGLAWLGTLPLLPLLLVVFPDGVPRHGAWRRIFRGQLLALAALVTVVLAQVAGASAGWVLPVAAIAGGFLVLSGVLRAASLVVMCWRSPGDRRRQLLPFVVVAGLLAAFYGAAGLQMLVTGRGPSESNAVVDGVRYAFIIGALPIALGLSVVRHRLYGIEVVVNRVAVTAFVSVMLFGVYVTTVAAASAFAGGGGLQWPTLLAAGATVAALAPLYRLARTTVDRVMFGDRDRPDRVLRNLAVKLGDTVDPLETPQIVVDTVASALRLSFVALDRQTTTGPMRAAGHGSLPAAGRVVTYPITYGEQALGELLVAPRAREGALSAADHALLTDLAAQAGPALYAGRLTNDLADSRERLRRSRLEERAQLRRDLHDGISPTLSGIAIASAAARRRDPHDPEVRRLLMRIEAEAGSGATMLGAMLAGLRPPGLDELGLVGAIEQRAAELAEETGLPFDVQAAEPLPPLAADVEQAAYLITVEGMTNVARHAAATRCHVSLSNWDGSLHVTVTDDGHGMPSVPCDGDGLRSARERAAACGGVLSVQTVPPGGAQLEVRLPIWARP